jgi:alpha-tubulin suppressor-like RCC1 family protein
VARYGVGRHRLLRPGWWLRGAGRRGVASGAALALVAAACAAAQMVSPSPASAAAAVPAPAGQWMFEEGSGTTTADSSGNGHTGTLAAGATWTVGDVGANAIATNGTSTGNVSIPGAVVNTSLSFTVSAWVYLTSIGGGNQTFVSINGLSSPAGTTVSGFYLQFIGGLDKFALAVIPGDTSANGATNALSTTLVKAATWYHLVGVDTVSGGTGTLSLYVNGTLQATATVPGAPWQATGNTMIGQGMYNGGQVDFVNGKIDDVALYSSALAAAQIAALNQPVIAAGSTTSCMISSGNAYCWGDNSTGALGNNSTINSSVPVPVYTGGALSAVTLTRISVGNNFACALSSAGAAYCWGFNSSGQLGNSTTTQSNVPVLVSGGLTFTQIDTGATFACALTSAGAAYCWGAGNQGQLGNGTTTAAQNTPVPVTTIATPLAGLTLTQISTGTSFACALSSGGAAFCWGKNSNGQLGNGTTTTPQTTATAVTTAGTALAGVILTQIGAALGGSHACALSTAGAAYCWGLDASGQLGNNSTTQSTTAVAVTTTGALSGVNLTQVAAGQDQTCALGGTGAAYCWGGNANGDLGINSTTQSLVPVAVSTSGDLSGKILTQVSAGGNFLTCTLDTFGAAYCWGLNSLGEAGNPATAVNFLVPVTVAPSQATTIAGGNAHSCEIRSGKAYCWGDNASGELGNNTTISSHVPVAVYTGGVLAGVTLTQIATGSSSTCALSSAGAAYCWGNNGSGQLGNKSTSTSHLPVAVYTGGVLAGVTLTRITTGASVACALDSTGAAYCWGSDGSGQLGNGVTTGTPQTSPLAVTTTGVLSGLTLTQVSASSNTVCALASTGAAYCWGTGTTGQLGNGTTTAAQNTPVAVTATGVLAGVTLTQLAAGLYTVCSLASTGAAYCWGNNSNGQLGINSVIQSLVPVAVTTTGVLSGVTLAQITLTSNSVCSLASTGAAYCWGYNIDGQLGINSTTQSLVPVAVSTSGVLSGVTLAQITTGTNFVCALAGTGAAYCWGLNSSGQLGNPVTASNFLVPVAVPSEATMVASGNNHSCLLRNGKAFCWGDNTNGELGNNSTTPSNVPVPVSTSGVLTGVVLAEITAGQTFTCALSTTGNAYCWGFNAYGQLGNSSFAQSLVPVAVTTSGVLLGKTLGQITAGNSFTCALSTTGSAYCWGYDGSGNLGDNLTANSNVPVAVTTAGTPMSGKILTQIGGGYEHSCAVDAAGAAYCWGYNNYGELGNSSTATSGVPVAVTTAGTPMSGKILTGIVSGNYFSCAVDTTGLSYCWGYNNHGQLGNGATSISAQTTAVAVTVSGALSGVTLIQLTAGESHICALASTGLAYCWGQNSAGQLGNTSNSDSSTAVAVTTSGVLSGVTLVQISTEYQHTCALDSTGAAYCWGLGTSGQLGNNTASSSNVAVTVQGIIPGAPTGVIATPGDTTATISWTAPTSFGTGTLIGYTATATAASGTFTCTTAGALTCVINALTDGTTYSVTVFTHTTDGDSPPSSPAVTVTPVGVLSLTSPGSLTWAVTGNGTNQSVVDTVAGDQQLTVNDNTFSGAGWHVMVSATTFTNGTHTLPNSGTVSFTGSITSALAITAPTATCVTSCTLPTDTTAYPVVITTAASSPTFYTTYDTSALTGKGAMTIGGSAAVNPIGWWVQVPGSIYAGTYTTTVSLEIISGP